MEQRLLITGANGQLGNCLHDRLELLTDSQAFFTDIDTLDITNEEAFSEYIQQNEITCIINCAAYTAVDKAEDEPELCRQINTEAVRIIGKVATEQQARVIHVSTDYVFDGKNYQPYTEDQPTNPISVYGQTKRAGEEALLEVCPDSMIIRTAWLYSEYGNNFVKTMLRLGNERSEVRVVSDQIGTPTYAGDLADVIVELIANDYFTPGIYHFTNEGVCSWYDFAREVFIRSQVTCRVTPIGTADYPTRAQRPFYSVLNKNKIKSIIHRGIPHWTESLQDCLKAMNS